MKRLLLLFVLGIASFTLSAQSRLSYSLELVVGIGVGKGPLATFTPEFIASYNLGGFIIGAGAGVRYARPCGMYNTKYGRDFQNELDIPVFLRLGFRKAKFFANVDAGYAIGVLGYGYPGVDYSSDETKDFLYDGLFVEPHVGLKVGRHSAISLGILMQKSTWYYQDDKEGEGVAYGRTLAITLRYALSF